MSLTQIKVDEFDILQHKHTITGSCFATHEVRQRHLLPVHYCVPRASFELVYIYIIQMRTLEIQ